MENTYINGIENALLSGNGNSSAGYIGSLNSLYFINGVQKELTVTDKTSSNLVLDIDAFKAALPYDTYTLYDADDLDNQVLPYVGAGSITMSANDWLKTKYESTQDSSDDTTGDTTEDTTQGTTEGTTSGTTEDTTQGTTEGTTSGTTEDTTSSTTGDTTDSTTSSTTGDTTDSTTSDTTDSTTGDTTEDTTQAVSYSHNFTTDGKDSSFYTITGNLSTSKGTVTYDGMTLTSSLKMESSTKVTFTTTEDATTTFVFNSDCNKSVTIDGETYKVTNGILEVQLAAGTHTFSKADSNVNLYYINTVVE